MCGFLALLQNHWIAELSRAEKERLQQQLQTSLSHLSREFNSEINNACAGLLPADAEVEALGVEKAYANRYFQWRQSHDRIFQRIALVLPQQGAPELRMFDPETAQFLPAEWPSDWASVRDRAAEQSIGRMAPAMAGAADIVLMPRFGGPRGPRGPRVPQREWLVVQLNLDYMRATIIPDLLRRYLAGTDSMLEYDAEVVMTANPSIVIYRSAPEIGRAPERTPDASVPLFDVNYGELLHLRGRPNGGHPGPPPMRIHRHNPFAEGDFRGIGPPPPVEVGGGRWRLLVRHRAGSLEAVVAHARWQNLATSAGVLLLILMTAAMLVRFSRRAQHLADVQMNFVAGVSHELRTPLAVIRTAAFNLRGQLASKPDQVERYGSLIQDESEKLSNLVEQILLFSRARAGHAIQAREPTAIESVIEKSVSAAVPEGSRLVIERHIDPGLPLVLADELALKHAIQNLIENAVKYGTGENNWIGIYAAVAADKNSPAVEVRVADHGYGIPEHEQQHIFDPFFRGRRAIDDQVHGTGLGLNLVKRIVEAHGGSIRVQSELGNGAEFVIRIPAAPELQHEFAHSLG